MHKTGGSLGHSTFFFTSILKKLQVNISCCGGRRNKSDSASYQVPGTLQGTDWEMSLIRKDARQGEGRAGRPLEQSRRVEGAYREGTNSSDLKTIPGTPLIEEQP